MSREDLWGLLWGIHFGTQFSSASTSIIAICSHSTCLNGCASATEISSQLTTKVRAINIKMECVI